MSEVQRFVFRRKGLGFWGLQVEPWRFMALKFRFEGFAFRAFGFRVCSLGFQVYRGIRPKGFRFNSQCIGLAE